MELIQVIEELIGKPRRMRVSMQRYGEKLKRLALEEQRKIQQKMDDQAKKAAEEAKKLAEEEKKEVEKARRPSRFEVKAVPVKAPSEETVIKNEDPKPEAEDFNTERRPSFLDSVGIDPNSPAMKALIQLSTKPKKSILKKSNSYTIHSFGIPGLSSTMPNTPAFTDDSSWKARFLHPEPSRNYKTVTGAEVPKWKNALDSLGSMFKKGSSTNVIGSNMDVLAMAAGAAVGADVTTYMGAPEV